MFVMVMDVYLQVTPTVDRRGSADCCFRFMLALPPLKRTIQHVRLKLSVILPSFPFKSNLSQVEKPPNAV